MRARELAEDYPSIDVTAPAVEAARMIGTDRRPAVVVLDEGRPLAVLPGSEVLRMLIPAYLREDPSLVATLDEGYADAWLARLDGKTVGDVLPREDERPELPSADADDNVLECAATMARLHSPMLVVVGEDGVAIGVITASRLLETLVG